MLKKQRELCTNSPLPALIRIDTDVVRKIHFQQDYLGCVEDEANIVKKCDARRQEISGNIFPCLSRRLDRLMSIMMTTAVYVINSKTMSVFKSVSTMAVFVSKNMQCYDAYDEKNKVGIDMGAIENSHSDNDLFSNLPRELDRVLTCVLTAVYRVPGLAQR